MFEKNSILSHLMDGAKAAVLASACIGAAGCGSESSLPGPSDTPAAAPESIPIGQAGDATFFIKEFDGHQLLVFDGYCSNGLVDHLPSPKDWQPGNPHTFACQRIEGDAGSGTLYHVKVDGVEYIFVDGYKGGGITRMDSRP